MGVENNDTRVLYKKVVFRISQPVASPADSKQRMFLNHGDRTFPQSQAKRKRCILAGKKRNETLCHLSMVKK